MSVAVAEHISDGTCRADTPCAHCGLPVGAWPIGDGPYFCCTGCSIVYEALQTAGLGDTYYRLRSLAPKRDTSRPARTGVDPLQLSELDTETFLTEHTRDAGDGARTADLFLDGVHCAACVWLVERMPFVLEGVEEARLDLPRALLTIRWRPDAIRLSGVARWLARFGYALQPARQQEQNQRTTAERSLLIRMGVSWALAGNVMLIAFALYAGLDLSNDPAMANAARWVSFALSVPSVLYGGSVFFRRAWASVRMAVQLRRLDRLHMDTPIALGILVGFAHSAWATITGTGEVWFDSITVLIAALLTARWLQLRSRRFAGDATERLLSLLPSMARRIRSDGTIEVVRSDEIASDDLVEVPAGEVFPVDGIVHAGNSAVNNAVLTGESRPEPVAPGTAVEAGATNLTATVQVRVRTAGRKTRVGQLLAWIRDHENRKAPVLLLADRLGGYFVLSVLGLALLTLAVWLSRDPSVAAAHVVALLVITCPCALGMATPLAMAVAAGRAARAGIFIKSDGVVQQLTEVNCVVLDKTGTLTEGTMTLVAATGDEAAIDLAAVLEKNSNHPIAAALQQARAPRLRRLGQADLPVEAFTAVHGSGIYGRIAGHDVAVGRPGWIESLGGTPPAPLATALAGFSASGYTPVGVSVDGRFVAALAFGDRLRDSSVAFVRHLEASGKEVHILSGDHPDVVRTVAGQLGLPPEQAHGSVSPEEKHAFVERLRSEGKIIAMVGDGVNDAAALQAAHVGIAVHGGSTASKVAADVFMTRPGLEPLADLLAGARRVMHVIRRNLAFSLVYNAAGAAAAMLGLVTPLVAAIAMPISSLIVVISSILQRSFVLHPGKPHRSTLQRADAASAVSQAQVIMPTNLASVT